MLPTSTPGMVFGSAFFGDKFADAPAVQSVLDLLSSQNIKALDTASRYPPSNPGRSETLIGEVKATEQSFTVDTKILASSADHKGELSKENINKSVAASLDRLGTPAVHTLYIHFPDSQTPLEEQTEVLNELYREGKFSYLGVSNFTAGELHDFLNVCEKNGYIKPTVYQGDYSLVNRGMEKHLLPLLREHGIVFNAFRSVTSLVIAAGFLTGSFTTRSTEGTRFHGDGPVAKYMTKLYDNEALHKAQQKLAQIIKDHGISAVESALRWAKYHSALKEGDGIILGASQESQIKNNIQALNSGPLPHHMVQAIEEIWEDLKMEREDKYLPDRAWETTPK